MINKLDKWFIGDIEMGVIIWEGELGRIARRCVLLVTLLIITKLSFF